MQIEFTFDRAEQFAAARHASARYYPMGSQVVIMLSMILVLALGAVLAIAVGAGLLFIARTLNLGESWVLRDVVVAWSPIFGMVGVWVALLAFWPKICSAITGKIIRVPTPVDDRVRVEVTDAALVWNGPESRAEVLWHQINEVFETRDAVMVTYGLSFIYIPKSAIGDDRARDALLNLLRDRVQTTTSSPN